jgi:RNase adapter protein RapZ
MTGPSQPVAPDRPGSGRRIVLVTGPSGAGRSTAINVLEDLGYEAIDNLPLSLIPRLLDGPPVGAPLALGIDVRNRDFSATALIELIDTLTRRPETEPEVLFLDCARETLLLRYGETRRRHPLAPAGPPALGIDREIDLLAPVRARADILVDTTDMSPHDLRAELARWFDRSGTAKLAVSVQSFSYKRGLPRGVDMVFDCRFLRNPHWVDALRPRDGLDAEVARYVAGDARYDDFFVKVADLVLLLLPAQMEEGKSHLSIAFGCTGGRHRSVTVVENLAATLAQAGWQVSKRHRELERAAQARAIVTTG